MQRVTDIGGESEELAGSQRRDEETQRKITGRRSWNYVLRRLRRNGSRLTYRPLPCDERLFNDERPLTR
jgi:hypothetical protein